MSFGDPRRYTLPDGTTGFAATPEQARAREAEAAYKQAKLLAEIDAMTHVQLATLWRHAPTGSPLMQGALGDRVKHRLFTEYGGFTPAMSKQVGW